jgi:hypothetical protein
MADIAEILRRLNLNDYSVEQEVLDDDDDSLLTDDDSSVEEESNVSSNESAEPPELIKITDLQLHDPVRGIAANWINKRHDYERDLSDLSKRMFTILEKKPDIDGIELENIYIPRGLKVELMDHQVRSFPWIEWREKTFPYGAILGKFL